jgi:hypothetical protein
MEKISRRKKKGVQGFEIASLLALGKATENSPAANYYTTYAAIEKSKL